MKSNNPRTPQYTAELFRFHILDEMFILTTKIHPHMANDDIRELSELCNTTQ